MNAYNISNEINQALNEAVEAADAGNVVLAKDKIAHAENLLEALVKTGDVDLYVSVEKHVDETANIVELLLLGDPFYEEET